MTDHFHDWTLSRKLMLRRLSCQRNGRTQCLITGPGHLACAGSPDLSFFFPLFAFCRQGLLPFIIFLHPGFFTILNILPLRLFFPFYLRNINCLSTEYINLENIRKFRYISRFYIYLSYNAFQKVFYVFKEIRLHLIKKIRRYSSFLCNGSSGKCPGPGS